MGGLAIFSFHEFDMLMRRGALFIVVATALLVGCDSSVTRPEPNTPDALAVTAILGSDADTQAVALTTVSSPLPGSPSPTLVSNATVQVDGTVFTERQNQEQGPITRYPRQANYWSAALDVQPGSTYALTVEKGTHALTGTVAVPDTFRGWADGRRLRWTKSDGAARYRVHVEDAADTPFEYLNEYTVPDTTVVVGDDEFTAGQYYVEIYAQDPNLAAFMGDETDRAGVAGGYGLFGARTLIAGTVTLSMETEEDERKQTELPLRPARITTFPESE